jgi:hypothetical protein
MTYDIFVAYAIDCIGRRANRAEKRKQKINQETESPLQIRSDPTSLDLDPFPLSQ